MALWSDYPKFGENYEYISDFYTLNLNQNPNFDYFQVYTFHQVCYQGIVKATVFCKLQDLKFKISEGFTIP